MPTPQILNLHWQQGSDNYARISLMRSTVLRCPCTVSTAPSTIKIEQLGAAMTSGQRLRYGRCHDFVLAANLGATDEVASVTAIPISLPTGTALYGDAIDMASWTFAAKMTDGTTKWTINATLEVGKIYLLLPKTTTAPANCTRQDILKIEDFDLQNYLTWGSLKTKSYRWDLEATDTAGITTRRLEGNILLTGEVTA
jgi:hypothetical protein